MTEDSFMEEMTPAEVKPPVTLADLQRLDIRVGTILRVEEIEGSRSLMRLIVDLGNHQRTILAGIKEERSDPSVLNGQQALFVVNLEPKKMMGELSEGMLFDIGYADGVRPALAVPERVVPNGARAG
jgi:tRNA-binding protein